MNGHSDEEKLDSRHGRLSALRRLTYAALVLLTLQFLAGTFVNLFNPIPARHPGAKAEHYFQGVVQVVEWAVLQGAPGVAFHAALGLFLVLFAGLVLILAAASRRPAAVVGASFGFLGILAAGFNGASFLVYGEDASSLLMAGGFALALLAYVSVLYIGRS